MIIDIHIHAGSVSKDFTSGFYMSRKFRNSPAFFGLLATRGIFPWQSNAQDLVSIVVNDIQSAQAIDYGVMLAFDAVYTDDQKLNEAHTHFYTANERVIEFAQQNDKILFGASVHPNRPDALELLEKYKEQGAVLVKWLPSTQQINPKLAKYQKFYNKLVELELPLLCHVGAEHTLPSSLPRNKQNYLNDPMNLEFPLNQGVTIIAAHCALRSIPGYDPDHFSKLVKLFDYAEARNWKLYGDVSAFCLPNRIFQVAQVKDRIPSQRLILGSDYPIPSSRFCYGFKWSDMLKKLPQNPLDKNVFLLKRMGFEAILENASQIIKIPQFLEN